MLRVDNIHTFYGKIEALKGISIEVNEGEIVTLIGANGAGKSTTLKTISGQLHPLHGTIEFLGETISGMPSHNVTAKQVIQVPEGRRIFPQMTVRENLDMGAFLRTDKDGVAEDMEKVLELFPRLRERLSQKGGTLSGGEQQMVAFGRALMSRPRLIIMDEPSMGLAPALVDQSFDTIAEINKQGVAIFVVEQNATAALSIADRGYVLQNGQVVLDGLASEMLENEELKRAYLGG